MRRGSHPEERKRLQIPAGGVKVEETIPLWDSFLFASFPPNSKMGNSGPYSELEYLILAMVGEGCNSGYAMRKEMNRMRGGRWSAESGSVYRVVRRLERDHLLAELRKVGVPNRERTEYCLTPQGEALLNSWLTFPPDRSEFAFLVDPLRTRSYFISRLKPSEQVRVVKAWLQESKQFVADLTRDLENSNIKNPVAAIAYSNLLHLAQARHEWLKKMLQYMKTQAPQEAKELEPV
jgi:DNA-binding PadR family transcriptional regulator